MPSEALAEEGEGPSLSRESVRTLGLSASLSFKDDANAVENGVKCGLGQVTGALAEERPVDSDDLRNVRYGVLREPSCPDSEKYVSRSGREAEIARKRNDDHRRDSASIESVSLDDQDGPSKAWSRSGRIRKIRPEDIPLSDYHSVDSSTRRAASETEG